MSIRHSLSVMVVDDMATSRSLITQALDTIGLEKYTTENDGHAALQKLIAQPVHLVLSDMNMPHMDGLQLLEGVRQNPATKRMGFILVTGAPTPEIIERGRALGLNNLIRKPFTPQIMKSTIEAVVGRL